MYATSIVSFFLCGDAEDPRSYLCTLNATLASPINRSDSYVRQPRRRNRYVAIGDPTLERGDGRPRNLCCSRLYDMTAATPYTTQSGDLSSSLRSTRQAPTWTGEEVVI